MIYNVQHKEKSRSGEGVLLMTEKQAAEYISQLTREEKLRLNEMLKALAQKRPLSQAHQETAL